ncbi:MAG: hypothetical protein AUJ07_10425 [Crenarchaeota archaeon 13_1_40CM_3_53_5]|nr:MAG: hypothetical protein AUJ07_10425 [Crenarchaeota archaeon 13_1_40CM_3_53_5]
MTLGGRPEEGGGHRAKNFSLDRETRHVLGLVRKNYGRESEFVERAIREFASKASFSHWFTGGKPVSD